MTSVAPGAFHEPDRRSREVHPGRGRAPRDPSGDRPASRCRRSFVSWRGHLRDRKRRPVSTSVPERRSGLTSVRVQAVGITMFHREFADNA